MAVGAFIKTATFSDGTVVSFRENDIVVFVGPNNTGKSVALTGLFGLVEDRDRKPRVVTAVELGASGTVEELFAWLEATTYVHRHPGKPVFALHNYNVNADLARYRWNTVTTGGLGQLARFFCTHLSTTERLNVVKPPAAVSLTTAGPQHPIHYLQREDAVEKRVSGYFRQAFATELIIHHNSGSDVPLYMGERPKFLPG